MSPPSTIASTSPTSASTASSACGIPCTSYSAATRTTALVHDLEDDALALPPRRRANDLAQRARDPALPPDHLADVVLRDVEPQHDDVVAFLTLDANGVGLVHEPAREVLEQIVDQLQVLGLHQAAHRVCRLRALVEPRLDLVLVEIDRPRIRL